MHAADTMKVYILIGVAFLAFVSCAPEEITLRELEEDLENAFRLGGDLHLSKKSSMNGLSSAEKQEILDAHNNVRAKVEPSASNMVKMTWSEELANTAQDYANKCIWSHNGARSSGSSYGYVGENLYLTSGSFDGKRVVSSWANEEKYYTYSSNQCSGVCGHYTQAVWASSEYLGCGAKLCSSIQGLNWSNAVIVVCNYGPGGNYRGYKPYKQGTRCSECPSGKKCDNGLCSDQGSSSSSGNTSGSSTCK